MKRYAIYLASFAFLLGLSNLVYAEELDPIPDGEIVTEPNLIPDEATVNESEQTSEDNITDELDLVTPEVLSPPEKTAVALSVSMMDVVNSIIDSKSCSGMEGIYDITLFTVGVAGQRRQNNMITAKLPGYTVILLGFPDRDATPLGSGIFINYTHSITDDLDPFKFYRAYYKFNTAGTSMTMLGLVKVKDAFSTIHNYKSSAMTTFVSSSSDEIPTEYSMNTGWGMNLLSRSEYPELKYWERIKFQRENNDNVSSTMFVRDLLKLPTSCRVTINMKGPNNTNFISQQGHLKIEVAIPGDPVSGFNQ